MSEVPHHVPADRVVDFDYFDPPGFQADPHRAWKTLQDISPRVFWTPRNGGHWVATRAAEMAAIEVDHRIFSHSGISVPRSKMPSLPLECDPPQHTGLRAIISPFFAPPTLARAEKHARSLAIRLIEELAPLGACEFQSAFARKLPISVFLDLVDLPMEDAPHLAQLADTRVREADVPKRDAAKQGLLDYLADVVAKRKRSPRDDLLSRLIHGQVDGRPLTEFELQNMLTTVLIGGLDTVASALGFVMRFLALHDDARAWLRARSDVPMSAVDELFRRHGVTVTARLLMQDVEFEGLQMKAGEQIIVPSMLIGLDDERFDDPLEVRFDRPNSARHGAFGSGPHRCPGSNLGRMEVRLVLQEWLARIPDFELVAEEPPVFVSGIASSVVSLPLRWQA